MGSNKLSFLTDRIIPEFARDQHSGYVTIVKSFFEYLERQFGEYDVAANLLEYRDIDSTVDEFLDEFRKEFAAELPNNTAANLKLLIKKIREFYKAKGSEDAFKFLFRAVYNSSAEFFYPTTGTLKTSTFEHKLSDNTAHLTDSDFWQDFSYVLRTGVSGHIYEKLLYAMTHPAGLKFFSEFKPIAQYIPGDIPSFIESTVVLLILDYIATILIPVHTESIALRIFDTGYGNGPFNSTSKYLWNSDDFLDLLDTTESNKLSSLDGQSQEQQILVFYNRLKQDINSMKAINRNVELFDADENTIASWNGVPGSGFDEETDISVTANNTFTSISTDMTKFINGASVRVTPAGGANAGTYTVSSTTVTTLVIVETTLTIESAATMGETDILTVIPVNWYATPLRTQPTAADDTVHIINLPPVEYAYTQSTPISNTFDVWSALATSDDGIFFVNGNKLIKSDLTFGSAYGSGQMFGGRPVTVSAGKVDLGDVIEYYVVPNITEEHTMSVIGDLVITLAGRPDSGKSQNLQVFSEGVLLYPNEYIYLNGVLTINSDQWDATVSATDRVEIVFFERNVENNMITHNTIINQKNFMLVQNAEKRRTVITSLEISSV